MKINYNFKVNNGYEYKYEPEIDMIDLAIKLKLPVSGNDVVDCLIRQSNVNTLAESIFQVFIKDRNFSDLRSNLTRTCEMSYELANIMINHNKL